MRNLAERRSRGHEVGRADRADRARDVDQDVGAILELQTLRL